MERQKLIEAGDEQAPKTVKCPLENDWHTDYDFGGLQVIWMMCVCMFGDYGTSPRWGWIKDWQGCRTFLEKNLQTE